MIKGVWTFLILILAGFECLALDIDMKRALDSVLKKYNDRFSKKGNIGSGR